MRTLQTTRKPHQGFYIMQQLQEVIGLGTATEPVPEINRGLTGKAFTSTAKEPNRGLRLDRSPYQLCVPSNLMNMEHTMKGRWVNGTMSLEISIGNRKIIVYVCLDCYSHLVSCL